MSNPISTEVQASFIDSPYVELFDLEIEEGATLYFHSGLDSTLQELKFVNRYNPEELNTYIALPIMIDGIETKAEGASSRPTITIANVTSLFRSQFGASFSFEDLVGSRIVRRRTFEKYLDKTSDVYELPVTTYIIDRVSSKTPTFIAFELASPFDVEGVKIPNRAVFGKYCSWVYQGYERNLGGCLWSSESKTSYRGVEYQIFFDLNDSPLIPSSQLNAVLTTFTGNHDQDDFVQYQSRYWRSEVDNNTETPGPSLFWKEVFSFTTYNSSNSYSINSRVLKNNKVWLANSSVPSGEEPSTGSLYWVRADGCSKELSGCKCRFQFTPTPNLLPSAVKDTSRTLPFGAFPGSDKFK